MSRASGALRLLRGAPRPVASWLLLVIGALLLFAGQFAFWAADALVDSDGFTERAVRTLDDEDVQAFVSHFLVEDLIEQGEPSLIAGRPLIEAAVQAVIGSSAFEQLYATALRQTHRTLFSDDPIVLQLVDASIAVEVTLASFSPELAESLPSLDSAVVELADSELVDTTLSIARTIRVLAALLPLLALAAFAASWAVARGRRRALIRIGITVAIVAAVTILALDVGKAALEEFAGGGLRGAAAAGVWDAFLGDLRAWNIALGAGGLVLAAAPQLASLDVGELLMRAWRLATAPQSNAGRLVRAIAAVALGWLALFRTDDLVTVVVALAGLAAIYLGLIELVRLLWKERAETAGDIARAAASAELRPQLSPGVRLAALAVLIAGGVLAIVVLIAGLGLFGGGVRGREAVCNGHAELCSRPLNEVAFAATHNSMSAASEGWLFAAHREGIAEQLDFGIRGLLIDVWFGFPSIKGVATELLGKDREAMVELYGAEVVDARDRIAAGLGPHEDRELYLCHGFCEVGATPLREALDDIRRFLATNPGEVLVVFIQDEAPAEDIAAAFAEAGLERYAYAHPGRDAPWPTLGELVERNQRLIVMTEHADRAPIPWLHRGFELTQETPFAFHSVDDLSCAPNRGAADSPLFLVNHWIEDITPTPEDAELLNARDVLLPRLRDCAAERGQTPNLVAVNFYRSGDLLAVIDEINGVSAAAAE